MAGVPTGNTHTMNKQDASKYLGIGLRPLERHTSEGRITAARRHTTPRGPALDYDLEELDRFKREVLEAPPPQVLAAPSPTSANGAADVAGVAALARIEPQPLARGAGTEAGASLAVVPVALLASLADVAATVATRDGKPRVPISERLTLNLEDAAALSGLSRGHLRAAIASGDLKAKKIGRGWRVKRVSLDAYISQL